MSALAVIRAYEGQAIRKGLVPLRVLAVDPRDGFQHEYTLLVEDFGFQVARQGAEMEQAHEEAMRAAWSKT